MIHRKTRQQVVPAPLNKVWDYFATPQNLSEITPPDTNFEVLHRGEEAMCPGQLIEYRVQFMPLLKSRWLTKIAQVEEQAYFVDEYRFENVTNGTLITDQVTYVMPFGFLGDLAHAIWVGPRLKSIFDYRRERVKALFGEKAEK